MHISCFKYSKIYDVLCHVTYQMGKDVRYRYLDVVHLPFKFGPLIVFSLYGSFLLFNKDSKLTRKDFERKKITGKLYLMIQEMLQCYIMEKIQGEVQI